MDQFSIVFVCSGNRFRSPLAEACVRRLTVGLPVTVQSFGTLQLEDAPVLPEAYELGIWCGIDLSGHRARPLGVESIAETDLLVGFDEEHVRRSVIDGKASRRRSFTLPEIVALLEDVQPAETENVVRRARRAVEEAAARRDASPDTWRGQSIPDPFGCSWRVYRELATEIRELSLRLAGALFGVSDVSGLPPLPAKISRGRFRQRR